MATNQRCRGQISSGIQSVRGVREVLEPALNSGVFSHLTNAFQSLVVWVDDEFRGPEIPPGPFDGADNTTTLNI